ncbi:MAG: hypothetical protein GTO12_26115, partial [Proteobacteria bacterium]|nr:hypothetical protein [Pseudomonadota bacterium]
MPTVNDKVGFLTDSRPEIKVHPVGGEDVLGADVINEAIKQIWDANEGSVRTFDITKDSEISGLGYFDVDTDESGSIVITQRDPRTVYRDPSGRDRYILVSDIIPK